MTWLDDYFARLPAWIPDLIDELHASKLTAAIPDTREHKPVTRRTRLHWRINDAREHAARWTYRRIAGYDPPDPD